MIRNWKVGSAAVWMHNRKKDEKKIIKISVRNLVEFILREGDIDNRHGRTASPEAMWEGSRIHKRIQKSKGANYHAEVPLKIELSEGDYTLAIEDGRTESRLRATGRDNLIFSNNFNHLTVEEDMHVTIDEIKGIYMNLDALDEPVGVHRAQAMCYAYIYALQHDLAEISVQPDLLQSGYNRTDKDGVSGESEIF